MNVDTFADNPSMKWYFISAVPFMACILGMWYIMKHILARQRQTPYQRGIYENFFHDMSTANPTLWSRVGPRDYVQPKGRVAKIKWLLIRRWSAPEKTIKAAPGRESTPEDDLGAVSKLKRYLIRRWTSQIQTSHVLDNSELTLEDGDASELDNMVPESLAVAARVLTAPATDELATKRLTVPEDTRNRPVTDWPEPTDPSPPTATRRHSMRRHRRSSSAGRSSGILIEEENWHWLHEQGQEGKWVWRSSSSRDHSRGKSPPGSPPPPPRRGGEESPNRDSTVIENLPGMDAMALGKPSEPPKELDKGT